MTGLVLEGLLYSAIALTILVAAAWLPGGILRRRFGARVAYAAWLPVPLCVLPALPLPPLPGWSVIDTQVSPIAAPPIPPTAGEAVGGLPYVPELLLSVWLFGAAGMLFRMLRDQRRLRQSLRRRSAPIPPGDPLVARIRQLGFPRRLPIERVDGLAGPMIVGVIPPRMHVPARARVPDEVLAHEVAHVRHGDPLWSLLACALRCLFWFLPWIHLAWRRLRRDQELAADEAVLARLSPDGRYRYGRLLLEAAGIPVTPACHAWPGDSLLKERMQMMHYVHNSTGRLAAGFGLIAVAFLGAGWVLAAQGQPTASNSGAVNVEPMQISGQVEQPRPLVRIQPRYPRRAAEQGVSGHVVLEGQLTRTGQISSIRVVEAEPEGMFEAEAMEAFSHWRFAPASSSEDANPAETLIRQRLDFQMDSR